jgi:hypothetical protein
MDPTECPKSFKKLGEIFFREVQESEKAITP